MPADFPINRRASGSPTKKKPPEKLTPTRAPVTDVQSGGAAGYQSARANAAKQTPAYRRTIAAVQRSQPAAVRRHREQVALARVVAPKSGNKAIYDTETGKYIGTTPVEDSMVLRRRLALEKKWANAPAPKPKNGFLPPANNHQELKRLSPAEEKKVLPAALVHHPKTSGGGGFGFATLSGTLADELKGTGAVAGLTALANKGVTRALNQATVLPGFHTAISPADIISKVPEAGLHDAINIPAETVPSLYKLGAEVAHGHVKQAGKEVAQPYVDAVKHPVKSLTEHPLGTILLAEGVRGGIGRTAGTAGRKGLLGARGKAAASRTRAPAVNPLTGTTHERVYSPDVMVKQVQVRRDTRRAQQADDLRAKAQRQEAADEPKKAEETRAQAAKVDPRIISEDEIKKRVDERMALNEMTRKKAVQGAAHAAHEALGKDANEATSLVTQGIAHASHDDLRAYLHEAEQAAPKLEGSQKIANAELRKALSKALDGNMDMAEVQRAADAYAEVVKPLEAQRVEHGLVSPEETRGAPLVNHAVRRMGARWESKDAPQAVARRANAHRAEKEAKAAVSAAETRVRSAELREAEQRGKARVLSRQADAKTLRDDPVYAKAAAAERKAADEFKAARQAHGNTNRNPDAYSKTERYDAEDRAAAAEVAVNHARANLREATESARLRADRAVHDAATAGHKDPNWVIRPRNKPERAPDGKPGRIAALGRRRVQTLENLERHAAETHAAKVGLDKARAAAAQARRDRILANRDGALVDQTGRRLSADDIEAHMATTGAKPGAYVNQGLNLNRAGAYFRDSFESHKVGSGTRTGEAVLNATADFSRQGLVDNAARLASDVAAHKGFADTIQEFAVKGDDGKVHTEANHNDAKELADKLSTETGIAYVPVKVRPLGGRDSQVEDVVGSGSIHDAINQAVSGKNVGVGDYAIMPRAAAARIGQHQRLVGTGSTGKLAQLVSKQFRTTVLALSTKWATGNVVEGMVRSMIAGAGPTSYRAARKVRAELYAIDAEHGTHYGEEFDARVIGGGNFGLTSQLPRVGSEKFADAGPILRNTARAAGAFWRAPGPKHLAKAWGLYTHFVFETVNRNIESFTQTALAGKAIKQSFMPEDMITVSQGAVEQAAHGLKNTAAQVRLGRMVDDMYGKYGKFSPGARRALMLYTPFGAWTMSAVKFLYVVLPRDHPVLTSLLASANITTQEWRKEHGLDIFQGAGGLPPFLQGSIPTSGGGHLRIERFTPFSLGTDPTGTLGSLLLPEASGVQAALNGRDWQGNKLRDAHGNELDPVGKGWAATKAFAAQTIPVLGQGQRLLGGEGSVGARLNKEFNPAAATHSTNNGAGSVGDAPQATETAPESPMDKIRARVEALHSQQQGGGGSGMATIRARVDALHAQQQSSNSAGMDEIRRRVQALTGG